MNDQERRDWQEIVDSHQRDEDRAIKYHWRLLSGDRAILAANAIVKAAREYVRASYTHLSEPTDTPPTTITTYQVEAFQRLVTAVGEVKG